MFKIIKFTKTVFLVAVLMRIVAQSYTKSLFRLYELDPSLITKVAKWFTLI